MSRKHPAAKVIAAARALAAAEGKADWRPFLKAAERVVASVRAGKAEVLIDVFPGYRPNT